MTTFLFWNVRGKVLSEELVDLANQYDLDALILAEPSDERAQILTALNAGRADYRLQDSLCPRIDIYTRLPRTSFHPLLDDDILSVKRLKLPLRQAVTLASVHFWSKLNLSDYDQFTLSARIREAIDDIEAREGHRRTILVGDLNMDPFSAAMTNSEGIHSIMCRTVAARQSRLVKGRVRHMFFNPMWSHFGDHPRGPPGTYYKDLSGEPTNYFWHTFDQVLVRYDLLDCFSFDQLRILTQAGKKSLLSSDGIPDAARGSDHLPIIFEINIPEVLNDKS